MNENNAIKINNVTKSFKTKTVCNSEEKYHIFKNKEIVQNRIILNNISLNINKGEVLGIIGRNGSGKSTLLKMISKIMEPDSGTIEIDGKVAGILELGMGFHKDMTGRENIYLKGAMYGFNKSEIDNRINDIIDYSDLGEYIDYPIRTYSSGMIGKLGFSIMVNVDADILLVDEIISTGDVSFSTKAREHFRKIAKSNRTVILVSHSTSTIIDMCSRVIWIEQGKIKEDGKPKIVCGHYQKEMTESFDMLSELADSGVADAQYKLACLYRDGKQNVTIDLSIANIWMKKAAENGNIKAQTEYGDMLFYGIGVDEDPMEAMYYYQSAANKGDNDARIKIATLNSETEGMERKELLEIYKKMSENNDPVCQYRYADLLLKTGYKNTDIKLAFEYYLKSAEGGYPNAQHQIGLMYKDGTGIERNINYSIMWLERAAISGSVLSKVMLADIFLDGIHIQNDNCKAFKWYLEAAKSGNPKSQYQIATMYRDGIGTDVNAIEAAKWFGIYSRYNLISFQNTVADFMFKGTNLEKDIEKSLKFYERSAECGNLTAMVRLETINKSRIDILPDMNFSLKWLYASADLGNIYSIKTLGDMFFNGTFVSQDLKKSFQYFEKASKLGDSDSTYRVAIMYKKGIGVEQNENLYNEYLSLASKRGNAESRLLLSKCIPE